MSETTGNMGTTLACWAMGGLAGIVATVMVGVLGDTGWSAAVFVGVVLAVVVGGLTGMLFATPIKPLHAAASVVHPAAAVPAAATHAAATHAAVAAPAVAPIDPPIDPPVVPTAPVPAAPVPAAAPVAEAAADRPIAADGKPAMLAAARGGKADDLKQIKGVGPKLEGMLHGMGIYHFDQIAGWRAEELAWVDDNLEGFKGRASRDNWVEQARVLAAGGETAFSRKVEEGGVY